MVPGPGRLPVVPTVSPRPSFTSRAVAPSQIILSLLPRWLYLWMWAVVRR